jgi:hypothetical protein
MLASFVTKKRDIVSKLSDIATYVSSPTINTFGNLTGDYKWLGGY